MKNEFPGNLQGQRRNTWAPNLLMPRPETTGSSSGRGRGPRNGPHPPKRDVDPLPYGLTPAELAIVESLEDGASNEQIAERRKCAVGTVKVHLGRIFRKLNVESRGGVIALVPVIKALMRTRIGRSPLEPFKREWIENEATVEYRRPGTVLFSRGDHADALYFLEVGRIDLPEVDAVLETGSLLGEIGVFAEDGRRTASAICLTPVRLLRVPADRAWTVYFRNRSFAAHVLQLATTRIMSERARRAGNDRTRAGADSPELVSL